MNTPRPKGKGFVSGAYLQAWVASRCWDLQQDHLGVWQALSSCWVVLQLQRTTCVSELTHHQY